MKTKRYDLINLAFATIDKYNGSYRTFLLSEDKDNPRLMFHVNVIMKIWESVKDNPKKIEKLLSDNYRKKVLNACVMDEEIPQP